jgi:hypothetical protein
MAVLSLHASRETEEDYKNLRIASGICIYYLLLSIHLCRRTTDHVNMELLIDVSIIRSDAVY